MPCQKDCFTLDSHMLTSSLFFSLQTQHDQSQGNTNTTNKKTKKEQGRQCSLCWSVLCQVMWHSSSCSLNELLTPVLRADVSTGKLDSRFPVNKPQVLQIKVCWNYSSCYKSTKLTFHRMNSKTSKHFQKFSNQTGSHPTVNNQPISQLAG